MKILASPSRLLALLLLIAGSCAGGDKPCPAPSLRYCQTRCEQVAQGQLVGIAGLVAPEDEDVVKRHFLACLDECAKREER